MAQKLYPLHNLGHNNLEILQILAKFRMAERRKS